MGRYDYVEVSVMYLVPLAICRKSLRNGFESVLTSFFGHKKKLVFQDFFRAAAVAEKNFENLIEKYVLLSSGKRRGQACSDSRSFIRVQKKSIMEECH
jgi:hypothetical protein